MNSIGVNNMIDILAGKNYIYFPDKDAENDLKETLIGHSIKKINDNTLELDNGLILEFYGNEGCICGAGDYDITELNECENIITNVEFEDICPDKEDYWGEEHCYQIFVYAENKQIKLMQCDGDDGNGYYGTGYHIKVRLKGDNNEDSRK